MHEGAAPVAGPVIHQADVALADGAETVSSGDGRDDLGLGARDHLGTGHDATALDSFRTLSSRASSFLTRLAASSRCSWIASTQMDSAPGCNSCLPFASSSRACSRIIHSAARAM